MKRSQKKIVRGKPNSIPAPKTLQINANLDDLPDVLCECGNASFIPGKTIKKLSAILSPDGMAKYVFIEVAVCTKCFKALPLKP